MSQEGGDAAQATADDKLQPATAPLSSGPAPLPPPPPKAASRSNTTSTSEPVHLFKSKHLFVQLHEYLGDRWRETYRWNHGLEEYLVIKNHDAGEHGATPPQQGALTWTPPHLPSISLPGMVALRDTLHPQLVFLDLLGCQSPLETVAEAMLEQLCALGHLREDKAATARQGLAERLGKKGSAVVAHAGRRNSFDKPPTEPNVEHNMSSVSLDTDDPLTREAEEETAHVLVDAVDWLERCAVAIARFQESVVTGLEEQEGQLQRFSNHGAKAKFLVICICPSTVPPGHHSQIGKALAAVSQDDRVVGALYSAKEPKHVIDAFEAVFNDLKVTPQSAVPTEKAIMRRAKKMMEEMAHSNQGMNQQQRWLKRQQNPFKKGLSVGSVMSAMQKFAVPLLAGIAASLVLANLDEQQFDHWAGYGPGVGHHGGEELERPDAFGVNIHGHAITVHFIVNDILMCLFFGLAGKEITEALQPGGSLYPPTRTTVNVLAATLGGVLGPIVVYLAMVSSLYAAGALNDEYDFAEYAIGWGVPTATDISLAWVTALCVFGAGHPAINYLLLLAIVDDGIGLMIIAFAYPDPHNPFKPVYLLLVLAGMLLAYGLRRLRCVRWQLYVFLAGPLAWCGLLYSALHPSLALVFVVPFIPMHVEDDIIAFALESDDGESSHGRRSFGSGTHPLHDFEESVKDFVDFIVLFAFGLVNAGVQVDGVGWLTAIVLISLVLGKTLGISAASAVASCVGCPPPAGISKAAVAAIGFIASAGLTVALFVSGEAFEQTPALMAQAKMGALLSVVVSFVAVSAKFVHNKVTTGSLVSQESSGSVASTEDEYDSHLKRVQSKDERLEDMVVSTAVRSLKLAHATQDAIQARTPIASPAKDRALPV